MPTGLLHAPVGRQRRPSRPTGRPSTRTSGPAPTTRRRGWPTWTLNHVQAAINYPNTFPRFAGQGFAERSRQGARAGRAPGLQRLDDRRLVRRRRPGPPDPVDPGPAVGSRAWRPPRSGVARPRAAAPSPSRRTRPSSGFASLHSGAWDPLWEACSETDTVVTMHIGSSSSMPTTSDDAPLAVSMALNAQNAQGSLCDWVLLPDAGALSHDQAGLRREPGRLDAVPARAHGRGLARGRRRDRPRQPPVDLCTRAGIRMHLRRPARAPQPRRDRPRAHPVRVGLPARQRHLAQHPRRRSPTVRQVGMDKDRVRHAAAATTPSPAMASSASASPPERAGAPDAPRRVDQRAGPRRTSA